MVIGSEARNHGIQFFDIDPRNSKNFSITADVTGLFTDLPVGRTHNVVVNEELGYAVSGGAQPCNSTCRAGLIFIDVSDISKPVSPGCAGQDGYVHDAECLVYRGPNKRYFGRDICYGYNEDTLTIYDVTDKTGVNASKIISRTPYVSASCSHQGAVLDRNWQEYLVLDDELDEEDRAGPAADQYPVTYIFDIRDLEKPVNTGHYKSRQKAIDHNQYVHDGLVFQSNYAAGLSVYDISGIPADPTGGNVEEVAYFDIYPEDDATDGLVDFVGSRSLGSRLDVEEDAGLKPRKEDAQRELFLFCVHVLSGQPARGTEITSLRFRNGVANHRNVFVLDGRVMTAGDIDDDLEENNAIELQKTGGFRTGAERYAVRADILKYLNQESIDDFGDLSEGWHEFLELDHRDPKRKRKAESSNKDDGMQTVDFEGLRKERMIKRLPVAARRGAAAAIAKEIEDLRMKLKAQELELMRVREEELQQGRQQPRTLIVGLGIYLNNNGLPTPVTEGNRHESYNDDDDANDKNDSNDVICIDDDNDNYHHDDEPSWRSHLVELEKLKSLEVPVVMLTATLPRYIEVELRRSLGVGIGMMSLMRACTVRENITYTVRQDISKGKLVEETARVCEELADELRSIRKEKAVAYCRSKKDCEEMAEKLG
ncbi:hypothetical protein KCU83_g7541, partial [Aureobasidium melanogenum]